MRLGIGLSLLLSLWALPASADVAAPGPARPSWDDTPLPMPDDDAEVVWLLLGVTAAAGLACTLGRGERALPEG